jgi:hypothetical protein
MNLHAVAVAAIATVNPVTTFKVLVSTGYQTDASGRQEPTYDVVSNVVGEIQALSPSEMQHADGMNVSTETRKVYLNGRYFGVSRIEVKGGDLLEVTKSTAWPFGTLWLVTGVLEQWPNWCCLSVVRQRPETMPA